jgi:putative transposase
MSLVLALLGALRAAMKNRADLALENLALRQQLALLHRRGKRPRFAHIDRLFWTWLSGLWSRWREVLLVIRPETVIRWHRQGFRAFWTWKSRHGQVGRPRVASESAELVRAMTLANPLWGAPRIGLAPIPWTPRLCRQRPRAPVGFGFVRTPVVVA